LSLVGENVGCGVGFVVIGQDVGGGVLLDPRWVRRKAELGDAWLPTFTAAQFDGVMDAATSALLRGATQHSEATREGLRTKYTTLASAT